MQQMLWKMSWTMLMTFADDVIDIADSVFDEVGVDVDAGEIADALKEGIARVAQRKGCCMINQWWS